MIRDALILLERPIQTSGTGWPSQRETVLEVTWREGYALGLPSMITFQITHVNRS